MLRNKYRILYLLQTRNMKVILFSQFYAHRYDVIEKWSTNFWSEHIPI
jgi:hypothetical protein